MSFIYAWTRGFLLCFLLNLSNIVLNVEGQGLGAWANFFTGPTLGNVGGMILESGGHSYAVIEVGTAMILLIYLFSTRELMFEIAERIQNGAARKLRAADFTLEVCLRATAWAPPDPHVYIWATGPHR